MNPGSPRRSFLGRLAASIFCGLSGETAGGAAEDPGARDRARMVEEIAAMARETARETGRARFSDAVMDAMRKVPRHLFVAPDQVAEAYRNHPLPIGSGQTISQPYIVALTTDLIVPGARDRVLEIGTGSGYQAAVLAEIVDRVYSIEIIDELAREARERLARLGYRNVEVRLGDGHAGWPEQAPFDAIVVTAAALDVPVALVQQLRPGGRMVIPVGPQWSSQDFLLIEKQADGSFTRRTVLPVRFVPMTGGK